MLFSPIFTLFAQPPFAMIYLHTAMMLVIVNLSVWVCTVVAEESSVLKAYLYLSVIAVPYSRAVERRPLAAVEPSLLPKDSLYLGFIGITVVIVIGDFAMQNVDGGQSFKIDCVMHIADCMLYGVEVLFLVGAGAASQKLFLCVGEFHCRCVFVRRYNGSRLILLQVQRLIFAVGGFLRDPLPSLDTLFGCHAAEFDKMFLPIIADG